jgi:hypothetical protein
MSMSDSARAEAESRQPLWLDGDDGSLRRTGFRSGFVDGAKWAAARIEPELDRAIVEWQRNAGGIHRRTEVTGTGATRESLS